MCSSISFSMDNIYNKFLYYESFDDSFFEIYDRQNSANSVITFDDPLSSLNLCKEF